MLVDGSSQYPPSSSVRALFRPPPWLWKRHQASISWTARLKHEEGFKDATRLQEFIRKRRLIKIPFECSLEHFLLFIMIFLSLLVFPMQFEVLVSYWKNSISAFSALTSEICQARWMWWRISVCFSRFTPSTISFDLLFLFNRQLRWPLILPQSSKWPLGGHFKWFLSCSGSIRMMEPFSAVSQQYEHSSSSEATSLPWTILNMLKANL